MKNVMFVVAVSAVFGISAGGGEFDGYSSVISDGKAVYLAHAAACDVIE